MSLGETLEVEAAENQLQQISAIARVRKAEVSSTEAKGNNIYRLVLRKT